MTANEMADELEQKLDRASSLGSPGYEDFEISSVLTEAQQLFVKKFIDKKNNRKGESFEETEIRNQGFSALISRSAGLAVSVSQVGVLENGTFFDLPTDFMYTIHEDVTIDKILCNTVSTNITSDVKVIGHDEVSRFKKNKYKKPYFETHGESVVWRLVYSRELDGYDPSAGATTAKRHQLVTDGTFNIDSYLITYLINPKEIIVDRTVVANQRSSILDESTHTVIIDMATSLMLERVKEQELVNIESTKDLE